MENGIVVTYYHMDMWSGDATSARQPLPISRSENVTFLAHIVYYVQIYVVYSVAVGRLPGSWNYYNI